MSALDSSILRAFLDAKGKAISGDRLAKDFGISRVAIWARLARLRKEGFRFTASPRKGYALTATPKALHPDLLDAQLRLQRVRLPCTVISQIDSTNSEAERLLASGQEAPFAIVALRQTAGRGRLGRRWHSEQPGNLYLSIAFRPFIETGRLSPFTLWMGLALCEHIDQKLGIKLGLKWPNDLLNAKGAKVAGMLTEARIDADRVRDLVFGIGLNIESSPAELQGAACSLRSLSRKSIDANEVAAGVLGALEAAWEAFEDDSYRKKFLKLFAHYDCLAGQKVKVTLRGKPLHGVAEGIDEKGALLLRLSTGRRTAIASGEVTLRTSKAAR
jgi:BirA family biotin operon repressor/biotin-[acetyl-CoA-carboxylase] ligase